jgi:hypothetical protein
LTYIMADGAAAPDLIQIKSGMAVFRDALRSHPARPDETLPVSPRPQIRHCPICGIAMQASKSRDDLADFDIFKCLNCGAEIRESRSPPPGAGGSNTLKKTP